MNNEDFKLYQPVLYKLFVSSKKKSRIANSYLLYGAINAPIKQSGLLLLESINCKEELACHKCSNCIKFETNNKSDFLLIDGENKTIKKEDIQNLEKKFVLTSLEKTSKPVYMINHIENITNEAINALLKFLEEPKTDITAVLTTTNIEKVLPTIISRSIKVKVNALPKEKFKTEMKDKEFIYGKIKRVVNDNYCEILSWFYSSSEECINILKEDDSFFVMYDMCENFLSGLSISLDNASYALLYENSKVSSTKCYNLLYLTLLNIFTSIALNKIDDDNPFKKEMELIGMKGYDFVSALKEIKKLIYSIRLNYSPTLNSIKIIKALKGEKVI